MRQQCQIHSTSSPRQRDGFSRTKPTSIRGRRGEHNVRNLLALESEHCCWMPQLLSPKVETFINNRSSGDRHGWIWTRYEVDRRVAIVVERSPASETEIKSKRLNFRICCRVERDDFISASQRRFAFLQPPMLDLSSICNTVIAGMFNSSSQKLDFPCSSISGIGSELIFWF